MTSPLTCVIMKRDCIFNSADSDAVEGTQTSSSSAAYFGKVFKAILDFPCFAGRGGRAAVVNNFMHGLSLNKVYPLSPFTAKIGGEEPLDFGCNGDVPSSPRRRGDGEL